jgi:hypothetical protein
MRRAIIEREREREKVRKSLWEIKIKRRSGGVEE